MYMIKFDAAESRMLRENWVDVTDFDILAPCVVSPKATMAEAM